MEVATLKERGLSDDVSPVEAAALPSPRTSRRVARRLAVIMLLAGFVGVAALVISQIDTSKPAAPARPAPAAKPTARQSSAPELPPLRPHPRIAVGVAPGEDPAAKSAESDAPVGDPTAHAPSDAEVRSTLTDFRRHLAGVDAPRGAVAKVLPDGRAVAPFGAPKQVVAIIAAGNEIATKPYKWGGGHGGWRDSGYDCSGSVSFALAGAGLLDAPLTSGGLMRYGRPGRGRWVSIYANAGHVFMVVAGLRFDTSGANGGTRWQPASGRSYGGFVVRHPPGL